MGKVTLNRKELYDLVWSTPLTTLAKQFEITPAKIKSICREKKIPLPDPGFWEKMKHKKEVQITELPIDNSYWVNVPTYITPTEELSRNKIKRIKDEIDKTCKKYLKVPDNLFKPDRLVLEAKATIKTKKTFWYGREEGYFSTDAGVVSIFVTRKNIKRSLRLVDAFIKLVRARDHIFEKDEHKIQIIIDGEKYDFFLREKQNRIEKPEKKNEFIYEASGLLVISVGQYSSKREFVDGSQPLEKQLSTIVAYLEYFTDDWKKQMAKHEAQRKVQEEKDRIVREALERKEKELNDFKNLFYQAKRYDQAQFLREYINAVEVKWNEVGVTGDQNAWIQWAKDKADWYDPLINRVDEFLTDNSKNDILKSEK